MTYINHRSPSVVPPAIPREPIPMRSEDELRRLMSAGLPKVKKTKASPPNAGKALSQTPAAIIKALTDHGPLTVKQIADHTGLSDSTIRTRAKLLRDEGQVTATMVRNPDHINLILLYEVA